MDIETAQVEALASLCHKQWSGWMEYLFKHSSLDADENVVIPVELANRWARQVSTDYKDLPDNEKESDRVEARRVLEVIAKSGLFAEATT